MKIIETHIVAVINHGSTLCKIHVVEKMSSGVTEQGGLIAGNVRKYVKESPNGSLDEISADAFCTLTNNKFASEE